MVKVGNVIKFINLALEHNQRPIGIISLSCHGKSRDVMQVFMHSKIRVVRKLMSTGNNDCWSIIVTDLCLHFTMQSN